MQTDRPEYERLVRAAYLVFNEIHDTVEEDQRVHREKVAADAALKATNPYSYLLPGPWDTLEFMLTSRREVEARTDDKVLDRS
jgi:hypothetical protein